MLEETLEVYSLFLRSQRNSVRYRTNGIDRLGGVSAFASTPSVGHTIVR